MKTNLTKRKYKAVKHKACGLCKPWKRGWEDKKSINDVRNAIKHDDELCETENTLSRQGG